MKKSVLLAFWLVALSLPAVGAPGDLPPGAPVATALPGSSDEGFVANKDGLQGVMNALASKLGKSVTLSQKAMRKQVTGNFDLKNPWGTLTRVAEQMGLIWYFDGQSIYVYDASEIKNAVVSLRNVGLSKVIDFLKKSGLYDTRYPIKGNGDGAGTFYVSGPPVYVDIVLNTANYMDQRVSSAEPVSSKIAVIQLKNTFVNDRNYQLRGQTVTIPGIATVVQNILRDSNQQTLSMTRPEPAPLSEASAPKGQETFNPAAPMPGFATRTPPARSADSSSSSVTERIAIQAFEETNSLLVKGRPDQIEFVKNLVSQLDVAKRHVELALWIIDISKDSVDKLGVDWSGGVNVGNRVGVTFNSDTPVSALDGATFLAKINALNKQGKANVVTRPVVLTQENVPALFDNSTTFYSRLVGERSQQLSNVTYGTMISVLPRVSGDAQEIEMVLNIEDGNQADGAQVDAMPVVNRTQISTVARVPMGKSLLLGGYSRNRTIDSNQKIPLMGDIPLVGGLFRYKDTKTDNNLRLFLIEPRVLENGSGWTPDAYESAQNPGSAPSVARTLNKLREYMDNNAPE